MERLIIVPDGWPCKFKDIQPGLFYFQNTLCFKSEYGTDAYVVESGEAFWGGTVNHEERNQLLVQPCRAAWNRE